MATPHHVIIRRSDTWKESVTLPYQVGGARARLDLIIYIYIYDHFYFLQEGIPNNLENVFLISFLLITLQSYNFAITLANDVALSSTCTQLMTRASQPLTTQSILIEPKMIIMIIILLEI